MEIVYTSQVGAVPESIIIRKQAHMSFSSTYTRVHPKRIDSQLVQWCPVGKELPPEDTTHTGFVRAVYRYEKMIDVNLAKYTFDGFE